ncbi:MaoC family dehydratase [Bowmanella dokdonensis]
MNVREFTPSSLPAMPAMLLKAAVKGSHVQDKPVLPKVVMRCEGVRAGSEKLQQYHQLTGWGNALQVHPAWPHCLALPLQLGMLSDKDFPFKVMGMVHMENRINQFRPILPDESLDIVCRFGELKKHRLGWQFSLLTEARSAGEIIWQGDSRSLVRAGEPSSMRLAAKPADLPTGETWSLAADLGRQYARVSGDYNPIHLYPWSARLFGFKLPIVHGMWSKARCISAISSSLPDRFSLQVSFRKPVFLPARVSFHHQPEKAGQGAFTLGSADGSLLHLSGRYGPLDPQD